MLEHISNASPSTLADLRQETGLTNATLLRILGTLQSKGWVRRNIVEGQYELSQSIDDFLGANARSHPLAEFAAPHLLEMRSRHLGFPSDLCALVGPGTLEVVESTRVRGPMAPGSTGLGFQPSMIRSAHGRAYLALTAQKSREVHYAALKRIEPKENLLWLEDGRLQAELEITKSRGYGMRNDDYFVQSVFDGPNLAAMAVPILSKSGIHGTLCVLWFRDKMVPEELIELGCLEDMRRTAGRIGVALEEKNVTAPRF